MRDHVAYLVKNEQKVVADGILPAEIVSFYRALFSYQMKWNAEYKDSALFFGLFNSGSIPAISAKDIFNSEKAISLLGRGLMELLAILKKHNEGMDFARLSEIFASQDNAWSAALISLLRHDITSLKSSADSCGIGVDEFIFVLVNWLKPLFVALRESSGEAASLENEGRKDVLCPVCGYFPDMALMVQAEGGKRLLHCSMCEHEWPYKRIACTVCGNEDMESLGYYSMEGENSLRIDYCESCKSYIKTVILNKFQEIDERDIAVENVLTAYLDASAIELGYHRP